jgi:hypothetical protein
MKQVVTSLKVNKDGLLSVGGVKLHTLEHGLRLFRPLHIVI